MVADILVTLLVLLVKLRNMDNYYKYGIFSNKASCFLPHYVKDNAIFPIIGNKEKLFHIKQKLRSKVFYAGAAFAMSQGDAPCHDMELNNLSLN